MKKKTFISIRIKLIILLSLSAMLALVLSAAVVFSHTYTETKKQTLTSLVNMNHILAENLTAPIEFDDKDGAENLLKTLGIDKNIAGAFIFRNKDEKFASFVRNENIQELEKELSAFYNVNELKKNIEFVGDDYIIVSSPIMLESEYIATFCIVASTDSLNKSVIEQIEVQVIVSLIALLIIILLGARLQKIFTKPIFQLKDIMDDVRKNKNYNLKISNNNNDEFYSLFDGFNNMIKTIKQQNNELESQKQFVQTLLDSQEQLIVTTKGEKIKGVNQTFLDFFHVNTIESFIEVYKTDSIADTFNTNAPSGYLQKTMGNESWIDHIISTSSSRIQMVSRIQKAMITINDQDYIFSVTATDLPGVEMLKSAVFTDITEMENAKVEIEAIHKHTRESIEYASLIQGALIPHKEKFNYYFKDHFALWLPKDLVGGDIYLFEELRDSNECLLMVIDCTGHGVPGAFVTMLVKAIERQIVAKIKHSDEIVSPAKILSIFNKSMKHLLKQETKDSVSNAGFDGGIMYYNKKEKIIKFAGAETPLFYVKDNELKMIKGDRYSVGYKKCDMDHEYKEHIINVKEDMQFYLTTDGYLDQNGGEKSFPFGKKRFQNIIKEFHTQTMQEQETVFLNILAQYQGNEESNDDTTLIGFKI